MVSLRTILSKKMPDGSQPEEPFDAMAFAYQQTEWYNNAEGHLDQEDGYDCPICRNKGYLRVVTEEGGIPNAWMRPCQCQKVRQSIRQMRRSGLQHIIQDYTFAKFQATEPWQQKLKAAAQAYAQSLEGWFFFGGQSGSGKTHLCTAICRKALHQGKQVRYMLWRDDVSRIKAVANQGEEYNAAIAPYKHAELLYIDDLFKTGRSFDSRSPRQAPHHRLQRVRAGRPDPDRRVPGRPHRRAGQEPLRAWPGPGEELSSAGVGCEKSLPPKRKAL